MLDGFVGLGKFLETDDGHTIGFWCRVPGIVLNELTINAIDKLRKYRDNLLQT